MINKTYRIKSRLDKVWQALIDPEIIKQWSGAEAEMGELEGSAFKLWGGDMWGTNTKIVPKKILEQDWFADNWKQPSKVVFKLKQDGKFTVLELQHSNVPKESESSYAEGWDDYYCGAIKQLLEE
jgi:uncharacterized protein YndB with AHSA1/START domain